MSRLLRALTPRRRLVQVNSWGDPHSPWDPAIWDPEPREFR